MTNIITLLICFIFTTHVPLLKAQKIVPNTSVTGICYAGNKVTRVYIPPPKIYFEKKGTKGLATVRIYYNGFPAFAIPTMEYAVSILETLLPPDTRLTIHTYWDNIEESGVLGQSIISGFAYGAEIDALNPYAYYPYSLAEKIAGRSLNDDAEADIHLSINNSINWYLGTDGNTPAQRYDLVTVVLHELFHGLGFYDSMRASQTQGSYGFFPETPMIYDTFIEDLTHQRLTDTLIFPNPSENLYNALTSRQLYFNGPLTGNFSPESRIRLYAPATFDPGSSISHLDEDVTLQENALMTPFIDRGEAIHNPGNLTMSILGDLGWINTRIIHSKPNDSEEALDDIEISVTISSDTTYSQNRVGLVYTFGNFEQADTIYLTSPNVNHTFRTTIPIPSYETSLRYYFFVEDTFQRLYRSPSLAASRPYRIYIGTDTIKPEIAHTPTDYYLERIDTIPFIATVTDNIGIDTVYVEYRINEGISNYIGLTSSNADIFTAFFNARQASLTGGDIIQYRIIAFDISSQRNISTWPDAGYHTIRIENLEPAVYNYFTDFSDAGNDFFNIGFEILQPEGFNSPGLHSEHPYNSPQDNSMTMEFTAMLRHPVIFNETGLIISFREVVLVEPGEPESLYGSPEFYDYVIVEASRDFGKTWFDLIDGYDSRYHQSWDSLYASQLDAEGNSLSAGTEELMKQRTIFPGQAQSIAIGDTLLFRFRIFSDPYAVGWGWAIDDLRINPLVDNVEKVRSNKFIIYPNPGNGIINIRSEYLLPETDVTFKVFNSAGVCVSTDYIIDGHESTINISGLPSGFYIIKIYSGSQISNVRYILIR